MIEKTKLNFVAICEKSIPDQRKSKFKVPEVRTCLSISEEQQGGEEGKKRWEIR